VRPQRLLAALVALHATALFAVAFAPLSSLSWLHDSPALSSAVAVEAQESPEEHFKYGSVGIEDNEGLPYWIWQVLPRMFPDKLPRPGGLGAVGLVWEPGRELPVGFAQKRVLGGDRVAINCAFCHTAGYRRFPGDTLHLVPGGPGNLVDPQAYVRFLHATASDSRFTAENVAAAIAQMTDLGWTDDIAYRVLYVPAVRKALQKQRSEYTWMDSRPRWGRGRIDPFNPVKFRILKVPIDETIGNSDMMGLWNMQPRDGKALHWDGLSASLREVVLSSALGDGASRKSIDLGSLERVESWIRNLKPPPWPFAVDAALAAAGRPVYEAECARCHAPSGDRTGNVIPLGEIGTDRHRLDMWTKQAADTYNAYADGYAWDFSGFRKTDGYVAVPLDGLWLRAPYLHNGSVPYLAELLEPAEQRTRSFYRGHTVYDAARIGFVSEGPDAERAGTPYDTTRPGNGNQGHLYGLALSSDQKRALVEFLKTL
jgi:hypothetical protein